MSELYEAHEYDRKYNRRWVIEYSVDGDKVKSLVLKLKYYTPYDKRLSRYYRIEIVNNHDEIVVNKRRYVYYELGRQKDIDLTMKIKDRMGIYAFFFFYKDDLEAKIKEMGVSETIKMILDEVNRHISHTRWVLALTV
jgi:hypothetical protein